MNALYNGTVAGVIVVHVLLALCTPYIMNKHGESASTVMSDNIQLNHNLTTPVTER